MPQNNNLRAACLIVLATSMITVNDGLVKYLTQVFSVGQIILVRGLFICAVFATFLLLSGRPVFSRRVFHRWNIARALLELVATFLFLTGLSVLPIALASTLAFTSPIFLALFAAVFLGERVGWLRWLVIIAGFAGVIIISNPIFNQTGYAVLFPIACAVFVALRDIVVRYVPQNIPSSQVAFTNAWVVTLGGAGWTVTLDWQSIELSWYPFFFAAAIAMFCGYLFYVMGSRLGELSFIAPFKYTSILLAVGIGYWVWGDVPTVSMFVGATIIIVSGLVLLAGEKRKNKLALAQSSVQTQ